MMGLWLQSCSLIVLPCDNVILTINMIAGPKANKVKHKPILLKSKLLDMLSAGKLMESACTCVCYVVR